MGLSKGNDQKSLVKKILENDCLPILAHSETDTEYTKSFVATTLSKATDGSYTVSGIKRMVKHAAEATHFLVTCRENGDAFNEEGISIACIPTDRDGIKIDSFA